MAQSARSSVESSSTVTMGANTCRLSLGSLSPLLDSTSPWCTTCTITIFLEWSKQMHWKSYYISRTIDPLSMQIQNVLEHVGQYHGTTCHHQAAPTFRTITRYHLPSSGSSTAAVWCTAGLTIRTRADGRWKCSASLVSISTNWESLFYKANTNNENIIIIIIIIIKSTQQCKAESEWFIPNQSKDPSPTMPTYRQEEEKGEKQ